MGSDEVTHDELQANLASPETNVVISTLNSILERLTSTEPNNYEDIQLTTLVLASIATHSKEEVIIEKGVKTIESLIVNSVHLSQFEASSGIQSLLVIAEYSKNISLARQVLKIMFKIVQRTENKFDMGNMIGLLLINLFTLNDRAIDAAVLNVLVLLLKDKTMDFPDPHHTISQLCAVMQKYAKLEDIQDNINTIFRLLLERQHNAFAKDIILQCGSRVLEYTSRNKHDVFLAILGKPKGINLMVQSGLIGRIFVQASKNVNHYMWPVITKYQSMNGPIHAFPESDIQLVIKRCVSVIDKGVAYDQVYNTAKSCEKEMKILRLLVSKETYEIAKQEHVTSSVLTCLVSARQHYPSMHEACLLLCNMNDKRLLFEQDKVNERVVDCLFTTCRTDTYKNAERNNFIFSLAYLKTYAPLQLLLVNLKLNDKYMIRKKGENLFKEMQKFFRIGSLELQTVGVCALLDLAKVPVMKEFFQDSTEEITRLKTLIPENLASQLDLLLEYT